VELKKTWNVNIVKSSFRDFDLLSKIFIFCKIEHEPLILLTFEEVIGFLRISAVNMKLKSNFHLWIEYKETSDSWNICLSFTFWAWMKWTEYCLTNTFLRFCAIHSSFCTSTSNFNCWNWNNCDTIHITKDQMLFCTISELIFLSFQVLRKCG